jgi:hypothetical protein
MTIPLKSNKGIEMVNALSSVFYKEYDEKWTGEIFKSTQRIMRCGLPIYRLKDVYDEEIKGTIVLTIRIAESRYTGR